MAQSNKVNKSSTEIKTTHVYVIIALLVVISGLLVYSLAVSHTAFASHKFH